MERQTVEYWKGKKDYEVPMIQRTEVGKKRSWEDNRIAFTSSQLQFIVCGLYTTLTVLVIWLHYELYRYLFRLTVSESISSAVVITFVLSWKPLCAVISAVNSVAMSTLEPSR